MHLSIRSSTARLLMYVSHIPCAAPGSPRRPTHEDLPGGVFSSNPFDFMQFRTLLRNGASPTPFLSITSALFPTQCRGEGISCPSAPHPSFAPRHRKSCVCHTSEKSPANSFICHTSKNGLPQVPCLPHLRYPPGGCVPLSPQFGTCSAAQSQASGVRRCSSLATSHHSRVTSHCHSSYCVHYRAVPQLAVNDGSVGKQTRFFRCLRKRADSGSGKGFSPRPVNGSGVPARPGSSIASRAWEHRSM